jgi:hypothetical protein
MQDVTITFTAGPTRGQSIEIEVGHVTVGRQPGSGGLELKNADVTVSRKHAELVENAGGVELRNLSPNGTVVDGKVVLGEVLLEPGVEVAIGSKHRFVLEWARFGRGTGSGAADETRAKASGPLASPVVRAVLVIYLLGMIGLAVWLGGSEESGVGATEWPRARAAYEAYSVKGLDDETRARRLARAEELVREVQALQTRGLYRQIAPVCREIMGLDNDVRSPLFQFGAKCLSQAK